MGTEALDDFVRIMHETGERDGFSTRPKEYFEKYSTAWARMQGFTWLITRAKPLPAQLPLNGAKML